MTTHAERVPCTGHHMSDFSRVKVDVAQTSFWRGREFRTFLELNIPAVSTFVIRVGVPINVVLERMTIDIDDGWLRLSTVAGGVEGGTWLPVPTIFNCNNMTVGVDREALVAPQVVLSSGGTLTGGLDIDVIRLRTANASGAASTVGGTAGDERGVAPGVYYFKFANLGNSAIQGVFHVRWEERG